LEEQIESFRKFLELSKSPETVKSYTYSVRKFAEFIRRKGKTLDDVTLSDIVEFLSSFSKRYAARHAYALRLFLKYIGKEQLAMRIPPPKYTTSLPEWVEEDTLLSGIEMMKAIAKHSKDRERALRDLAVIWLAYEAALRIGEVVRLNRRDFIPERREVIVHRLKTKGGEPEDHAVPISEELTEVLKEYLSVRSDSDEALFVCGEPPHRCSKEMIRLIFKKFARLIGREDLHFHVLRHSRLTHLALKNVDLLTLAKLAHHKNPASTMIYTHLSAEYLRKKIKDTAQGGT